ncbi:hypothetical protein L6452_42733 [Arctium lappa]|uniref:Uncharacterized protein n=1 Tax=Arctium lappa TaxID=4217 RepID=A0ACB8XJR5_ARCLA|nr:hypothetical protein L6452_42733 [Arctium lappa]
MLQRITTARLHTSQFTASFSSFSYVQAFKESGLLFTTAASSSVHTSRLHSVPTSQLLFFKCQDLLSIYVNQLFLKQNPLFLACDRHRLKVEGRPLTTTLSVYEGEDQNSGDGDGAPVESSGDGNEGMV